MLSQIVNTLCSSVGSLTNPHNLANTIQSKWHYSVADKTIKKYIDYLEDAFLFNEANRYDVKGKRYFSFPLKYYSTEALSLKNTGDFFRKIIILGGNQKAWIDENGIEYVGIIPFLLEELHL